MLHSPEEIKGHEERLELLLRKQLFMENEMDKAVDANAKFSIQETLNELAEDIHKTKSILSKLHQLPMGQSIGNLEALARNLNIDEEEDMGPLFLVNCDRKKMRNKFWNAFDDKEEESFQFYFISACPTQMPPSFAERMVYELLCEELNGQTDALHIIQEDSGRVKIQDLPIGRNTRKSKQKFKAYVQQRFRFADTQSFETFIDTGVPNLPYDYVAVIFEIHERKWEAFIQEYIQWMIDTFRSPHKDVPTFLFFFVIYIEGHHLGNLSKTQKEILDTLQQIDHRNDSTLLTPLLPVEEVDLNAWLMEIGERNPNNVKNLIDAFVAGLRAEDQKLYQDRKAFNMKDIEELQALVYKIANE
jgi:hypothetical protein